MKKRKKLVRVLIKNGIYMADKVYKPGEVAIVEIGKARAIVDTGIGVIIGDAEEKKK